MTEREPSPKKETYTMEVVSDDFAYIKSQHTTSHLPFKIIRF